MGRSFFLSALAALALATPVAAQDASDVLVIAHRGASGERPEHTLAAYERAIDQGADYVEPDLVATKDLVLVARHENEISGTTDVADRPAFADRRRTKTIDGRPVTGWFVEDFTLAELRTLRAKERLPHLRPVGARFDGLFQVPTFAEIVALVKAKEAETGRRIGLYPELKHPQFLLRDEGIDTVDLLLRELAAAGIGANDPIFIQSFEITPLRRLDERSDYKLVQLVGAAGGPADEPSMRYGAMVTMDGAARIADYADAIGADIRLLLEEDGTPSGLVTAAHAAGLKVHAWTLRKENAFLPPPLRHGESEGGRGCPEKLWTLLVRAGVDGVFTDDPAIAVAARQGSTCGQP
ncbi:glycerophosphodiester phosphodiesterase [Pelagerythrobacter rhizovicinus]|uniref:glycerophosphodiester phosphodiesterase n=1 Tax=Pelagerythrobacter rhizovicinus TaxID=2268576 RepID=A0A4Q2KKM2_9SPHN|nr:glycerophosphodiester phosphodiesterase [Pelagerythrobacter rhizovicinus]RXZ64959.1 glycerophosphodiester phosphodiesterase [Pelagerythrobacter rhizovicinus]